MKKFDYIFNNYYLDKASKVFCKPGYLCLEKERGMLDIYDPSNFEYIGSVMLTEDNLDIKKNLTEISVGGIYFEIRFPDNIDSDVLTKMYIEFVVPMLILERQLKGFTYSAEVESNYGNLLRIGRDVTNCLTSGDVRGLDALRAEVDKLCFLKAYNPYSVDYYGYQWGL